MDGLAQRGRHLREAAALAVRTIPDDRRVTVHPQSRDSFLSGLRWYEQRKDKGCSLVDCISMTTMRREGILKILTNARRIEHTTCRLAERSALCGLREPFLEVWSHQRDAPLAAC